MAQERADQIDDPIALGHVWRGSARNTVQSSKSASAIPAKSPFRWPLSPRLCPRYAEPAWNTVFYQPKSCGVGTKG